MTTPSKPWGKLVYYGIGSLACYVALFARTDGAFWLLPVVTALVFSYFHGGFTGCFWDVLGVQARQPVKKAVAQQEVEE
jgi:hypothetical protein